MSTINTQQLRCHFCGSEYSYEGIRKTKYCPDHRLSSARKTALHQRQYDCKDCDQPFTPTHYLQSLCRRCKQLKENPKKEKLVAPPLNYTNKNILLKKSKFNPDRAQLALAMHKYFKAGGTITVLPTLGDGRPITARDSNYFGPDNPVEILNDLDFLT